MTDCLDITAIRLQSASVPVSGLPVSRSGDVEGASPNERCWPPTSSTSNANSSDGVNSVPTSASLSRTDYPHRDEESPIDFASQLSNSGEATSSGMGSQTAKTDLPPSLDPIHRGQTPTEHQSSIATDIRDQGAKFLQLPLVNSLEVHHVSRSN